ncbi:hypothetical protein VNO77_19867 [Canavalia gladiata]|uniref:Uncharacterized protein n=1 Tax=Canavalia gladiata TaxID=3824 RepID=A0AAN9QQ06_CANGL
MNQTVEGRFLGLSSLRQKDHACMHAFLLFDVKTLRWKGTSYPDLASSLACSESPDSSHCPVIIWSVKRQFMPNEIDTLNSRHGPSWSLPQMDIDIDRMAPDVWHAKATAN